MRCTRVEVLHQRDEIPLVVRARFERTFFGLRAFAALVLLFGGGYLMIEALVDPIGASDMGVLPAGFAPALASFLLVYFVWPERETGTGETRTKKRPGTMEEFCAHGLRRYDRDASNCQARIGTTETPTRADVSCLQLRGSAGK